MVNSGHKVRVDRVDTSLRFGFACLPVIIVHFVEKVKGKYTSQTSTLVCFTPQTIIEIFVLPV